MVVTFMAEHSLVGRCLALAETVGIKFAPDFRAGFLG